MIQASHKAKNINSKVKPGSGNVTFHKAYKYKPFQYKHIIKCFYSNRKFSTKNNRYKSCLVY